MTIIDQKLIHTSQGIFDDLDKWNALFELHSLSDQIIKYWLEIGTNGLRNHFIANPSEAWGWKEWGATTDTRWYLKEFGFDSLAIGFGWGYEFHLHLNDPKKFDSILIDTHLKTSKYAKLLIPFGVSPPVPTRSGSKAVESIGAFNFTFESSNDGKIPLRELAWYAAHRKDDFIKQAADKIEKFTLDPEITRLLTELNTEAQVKPAN